MICFCFIVNQINDSSIYYNTTLFGTLTYVSRSSRQEVVLKFVEKSQRLFLKTCKPMAGKTIFLWILQKL